LKTEHLLLLIEGLKFINIRIRKNNKIFKFLVDTGASISVVKIQSLNEQFQIIPEKTSVKGIIGTFCTNGKVTLEWSAETVFGSHQLHVVSNLPLDADGILGSDFFDAYNAIINYETKEISLCANGLRINLPLWAKRSFDIALQPRSESFHYCLTNVEEESVLIPLEICEGVFLAGALVQPANGRVIIKILNTRETPVHIFNLNPPLLPAKNFEEKKFETMPVTSDRVCELFQNIDLEGLTTEEEKETKRIVAKFADVFHLRGDKLSHTKLYKQSINLKSDATPVFVKPYRLPHSQKEEIAKQVDDMLTDGIIEESRSEWSSPILLVPKKADKNGNKKWRVVIDYRRLNEKIQDEKFPLANVTDILDALSGAIYFSTLDLSQGFYQLEIKESDRPCTAFVTDRGQFQMKKLPMGLKISPSAFSRLMTIAMAGLNYEQCFVYLDDIIVFGRNLQQHSKNLISVLTRLRKVNLKLNPQKSQFLRKSVLYLGHQISEHGILPDPTKISAVEQYPCPKDANEVKRFVAFANYYRKFINNFATIANPLNKLSRKGIKFEWTEECQTAFESLKRKLVSPIVLDYPDLSESNTFMLTTDASKIGLGAVLANQNGRPVAFASRALNKQETNYNTTEIELLALVWATKHFRPYLFGRRFQIYTDHRPLIYLFSQADPSSRLNKFRMSLMEYNFTAIYVKGKDNCVADALSRISIEELVKIRNQVEQSQILVMTRLQKRNQELTESLSKENEKENLISGARIDHPSIEPEISEILKKPKGAIIVKVYENIDNNVLRKYRNITVRTEKVIYIDEKLTIYFMWPSSDATLELVSVLQDLAQLCTNLNINELVVINNAVNKKLIMLLKKRKVMSILSDASIKICILRDVAQINDNITKKLVLNDFHILPTAAHAGVSRMSKNIRKYYYWQGLDDDVRQYVRKCDSCQRYKHSVITKQPMVVTTTASSAFEKIFLDLIGPFEKDGSGYVYALTIQCELTKYITLAKLENKEANSVARALVENFILIYGIPKEIATDQGTEFMAEVTQETCKILHVKQIQSAAYHHQSIGSLENSHKHLGAYLRTQITTYKSTWSSWLSYWSFAFNTTVHTETQYTPFELVFGKICCLPSSIVTQPTVPLYNPNDYRHELKYRLRRAWQEANENLEKSKIKRKIIYDQNAKEHHYKPGDLVLVKNENRKKLDPVFKGPAEILKDQSPNVKIKVKNKLYVVHKNRIKPYIMYLS
jgi:transposase InsO family protein